MSQAAVQVLLLGENVRASSYLLSYLKERGCRCLLATSSEEGLALFQKYKFRLILSNSIQEATRMASLLERSDCSAFYALPVEHGCWWLPIMKEGQVCFGAPALRPPEFTSLLDQTLKEIRSHYRAAPKRPMEIACDDVCAFRVAS